MTSFRTKLKELLYKIAQPGSKRNRLVSHLIRKFQIGFDPINGQYRKWIRQYDRFTEQAILRIGQSISEMQDHPRFSILMPVYDPTPDLLDKAIQSVRDQYYPHWELCIADDASTITGVRDVISRHADEDQRIKVVFRRENGHISAASNSALDLASGDFVAFLDHDDLLHPLALYMAAETIKAYPDSELIYFDEDKITENGIRFNPYFKPDFDYELILRQNIVSHCGIYKLATIRSVGGLRVGMEGSQDHDLLLRVLELIRPDQIQHIPRVLYHWRTSRHSAAENINLKPYAIDIGERALSEHLARRGLNARVSFDPRIIAYTVVYEDQPLLPSVEIIIVSRKKTIDVQSIRGMIADADYEEFRLTLGLPSEEPIEDLAKDSRITIISFDPEREGISQLQSRLISASQAAYICLLDDRVMEFSEGWLRRLMEQARQEGVGAVGPKLLSPGGRVYSSGMVLDDQDIALDLFEGRPADELGYFGWGQIRRGFTALSGECLLFRKGDFLTVGGFTPQLCGEGVASVDLCLKFREDGLRNVLCPSVRLKLSEIDKNKLHQLNQSDEEYMQEKWHDWLANDPAINPNLMVRNGKIQIISMKYY